MEDSDLGGKNSWVVLMLGLIHTGRVTRRKQIGPVVVNGSVHTACKQHQRKNVPICMRVASRVLCELGLKILTPVRSE